MSNRRNDVLPLKKLPYTPSKAGIKYKKNKNKNLRERAKAYLPKNFNHQKSNFFLQLLQPLLRVEK